VISESAHMRRSALPGPQWNSEAQITEAGLRSSGIQSLAEAPRVAPLAGPSAAAAALRRQQLRVEARA